MRILALAAAFAVALTPVATAAALREGAKAPDFTTRGALAGKPFRLNLKEQLRRGPVVLYFFPKAFTQGCTLETRAFSEANPEFQKAGARVIGLSADDYPTLAKFSVEECRNAFPVAIATPAMIKAYDVLLKEGMAYTNRTSYVIAPDGQILYAHSEPDWKDHVKNTLAAVQKWKAGQNR
ncbi:peroxiredoxin [Sphingosinicella rhizophila]|uniref:thioredoxin-dependent peroxiredoxin n=1 Tax=Sphingosinicella rhizophila TaxID=3050082 RepID=A0ABU3Q8J9_9SPHN|nr:peroxiredoxin [Sphingosinicella sp. GR2756]MDT9599627.1 peroxiredoxin [Sphingosinicella sp. GR2756]